MPLCSRRPTEIRFRTIPFTNRSHFPPHLLSQPFRLQQLSPRPQRPDPAFEVVPARGFDVDDDRSVALVGDGVVVAEAPFQVTPLVVSENVQGSDVESGPIAL